MRHAEAMRIPKRWTNPWTGEVWKIKFDHNLRLEGALCDGICNPLTHEIELEERLEGRELLITVLHEAWHSKGPKNGGHIIRRRLDTILGDVADIIISFGWVKP